MGWDFDDFTDALGDVGELASYGLDPINITGIRETGAEKTAKENARRAQLLQAPDLGAMGNLENSYLEGNGLDRTGRNAQVSALEKLQEIYNAKGLTDADKAQLSQIAKQEAIQERGQRAAITQNAQARGAAGSGLELSQLLNAQQGTADRAASRDMQVQRDAQARSLDALRSAATLGGNIQGQDYQELLNKANAADSIRKFNFLNRQNNMQADFGNRLDLFNTQAGYNTSAAGAADARRDRLRQTAGDVAQVAGSLYKG